MRIAKLSRSRYSRARRDWAADGFAVVLNDCQRGANRSNPPNKISMSVVRLETLQRCFRGLELCFYSGMSTAEKQRRGVRDPQRGAGVERAFWQRLQPLQYGRTARHGTAAVRHLLQSGAPRVQGHWQPRRDERPQSPGHALRTTGWHDGVIPAHRLRTSPPLCCSRCRSRSANRW